MLDRRSFLGSLAGLAALKGAPLSAQPRFATDPFSLGVASGYPHPGGFVLWTRLIGDLPPSAIAVHWEIFPEENLKSTVASGTAAARPEWAHSVHVEPRGLEPGRWYWYRFRAGDALSPVGRTRTAPPLDAIAPRLRFAFGSCQQYEQGWFCAYRHMLKDDLDLIAFLGDYIYESSWGTNHVRKHGARAPWTLAEYRARYALYRSDPDLQAAHAACPWIVTWDDHEVVNDYAAGHQGSDPSGRSFPARRAAAYRAYYEHMPLPAGMRPGAQGMRIYTQLDWGSLARFLVLDDRQYRSFQACREPGKRSAPVVDPETCAEFAEPARSMLGPEQERWLEGALSGSRARWNLLAQQTPMARFDQKPGPGRAAWTDGWDGYPVSRRKLLDFVLDKKIRNPVALAGDVHSFNVNDLKPDFDDPASPVVASEFVGTSITAQAWAQEKLAPLLADNPHMKLVDSRYRGYVLMNLSADRLTADLRAMENVVSPDAACSTLASFAVENGRPGAQRY